MLTHNETLTPVFNRLKNSPVVSFVTDVLKLALMVFVALGFIAVVKVVFL